MRGDRGAHWAALRASLESFSAISIWSMFALGFEERVKDAGLEHVEPIWGEPPSQLVGEFVRTAAGGIYLR